MKLSHIDKLESESIHIIREVALEFDNPVMLYSIGKTQSNASFGSKKNGKFYKLMHIDTIGNLKK